MLIEVSNIQLTNLYLDEEARRAQSGPAVTGAQPMGSIDHYIERGHNERNEREQLMNNHGVGFEAS